MTFGDIFKSVKDKAAQVYSNFFYEGRDVAGSRRKTRPVAGQEPMPPQPNPGQQWPADQQMPQQAYYGGYQQPYQQQPYQQPAYQPVQPQQAYQQPYQQPQQAPQPEQQPRFRRTAQHTNNVVQVDFGAAQAQQPAQETQQQPAGQLNARIVNARGMGDCRTAITLLRNGDAVVIVMENITNPGDMRRLVDTLSGACYSLTATITKVSRYGVYLLAPQALAVFADQATNQMNASPARAPQTPGYQQNPYAAPQRPAYGNPVQAAQQPQPYAQPAYPQQQDFTQRAAAPAAEAPNFYQRPVSQEAAIPSFSNRPAGVGYAPDDHAAAAQ